MKILLVKNKKGEVKIRTNEVLDGDIALAYYSFIDKISFEEKLSSLQEELEKTCQNELLAKYNNGAFSYKSNSLFLKKRTCSKGNISELAMRAIMR